MGRSLDPLLLSDPAHFLLFLRFLRLFAAIPS